MLLDIPSGKSYEINNIIIDLDGTLIIGGELLPGAVERIEALRNKGIQSYVFAREVNDYANQVAQQLGVELIHASTGLEKLRKAEFIKLTKTAAIGNGLMDKYILKECSLGICVLQAEGAHPEALTSSDILVPSILDALDLLIHEQRLVAALRP